MFMFHCLVFAVSLCSPSSQPARYEPSFRRPRLDGPAVKAEALEVWYWLPICVKKWFNDCYPYALPILIPIISGGLLRILLLKKWYPSSLFFWNDMGNTNFWVPQVWNPQMMVLKMTFLFSNLLIFRFHSSMLVFRDVSCCCDVKGCWQIDGKKHRQKQFRHINLRHVKMTCAFISELYICIFTYTWVKHLSKNCLDTFCFWAAVGSKQMRSIDVVMVHLRRACELPSGRRHPMYQPKNLHRNVRRGFP